MKKSFFFKTFAILAMFGMSFNYGYSQDSYLAPGTLPYNGTVTANNSAATPDGPQAACWFDAAVEGDIWYAFTLPSTEGFTVFTTFTGGNSDTQLTLFEYTGGTPDPGTTLIEVGCADDNANDYMSTIDYCDGSGGTTYFVQVDSWQGAVTAGNTQGDFDLSVVTNANCVNCDPTGCDAGTFADNTPQVVCPNTSAVFAVNGWQGPTDTTACSPINGGMLMIPTDTANTSGPLGGPFVWSNPLLDGSVDDIAANSFAGPEMTGDWWLIPAVGVDGSFSNCSTGDTLLVTWADATNPNCEPCDTTQACSAGTLLDASAETICPGECATVEASGVVIPAGAGCGAELRMNFIPDSATASGGTYPGGFSIGVTNPYCVDDDVNGIMSGNGLDSLRGLWTVQLFVESNGAVCSFGETKDLTFLGPNDPACSGPDCSAFDTAPVDLTKSFDPVGGVQDRVQVKWFKDTPQVRYSDADAAMCDIKFWPKRNLDPVTGAPVGPVIVAAPGDTTDIVNAKKTFPDNSPREIFKWPVKFRADGANNNKRAEPNIRYEWKVRCECGHDGTGPESPWSAVKIFNTPDFDPATGIYTPPPGIEFSDDSNAKSKVRKDVRLPGLTAQVAVPLKVRKAAKPVTAAKSLINDASIKLYPNPTNDVLNIQLDTEVTSVNVKDMSGRTVIQETGNGSFLQISTSTLSDGMYMVELEINGQITRKPFMVKK